MPVNYELELIKIAPELLKYIPEGAVINYTRNLILGSIPAIILDYSEFNGILFPVIMDLDDETIHTADEISEWIEKYNLKIKLDKIDLKKVFKSWFIDHRLLRFETGVFIGNSSETNIWITENATIIGNHISRIQGFSSISLSSFCEKDNDLESPRLWPDSNTIYRISEEIDDNGELYEICYNNITSLDKLISIGPASEIEEELFLKKLNNQSIGTKINEK